MTTFTEAANAIRNRFSTEFHAAESDVPIAFDNVEGLCTSTGQIVQESVDGSGNPKPWVQLNVRPGNAQMVSFGPRTYRQPGVVMTQVFIPVGKGDDRANEIAEAVAGALRGETVSGVRFRATSAPQFVGPDGNWWQTNVTTPFEYDETQP